MCVLCALQPLPDGKAAPARVPLAHILAAGPGAGRKPAKPQQRQGQEGGDAVRGGPGGRSHYSLAFAPHDSLKQLLPPPAGTGSGGGGGGLVAPMLLAVCDGAAVVVLRGRPAAQPPHGPSGTPFEGRAGSGLAPPTPVTGRRESQERGDALGALPPTRSINLELADLQAHSFGSSTVSTPYMLGLLQQPLSASFVGLTPLASSRWGGGQLVVLGGCGWGAGRGGSAGEQRQRCGGV